MNAKALSIFSNLLILANLVVGFMQVHWAVILLFIVAHAITRQAYLKATATSHTGATATTIAPPVIKTIASVITAIVLAIVLYWLGYGVAHFLG